MRFLFFPALLVAVVGCSSDVYPTAHDAVIACHEWVIKKDKRECKGDSTYNYTHIEATPTILGFEGEQVIRRFKWRIQ